MQLPRPPRPSAILALSLLAAAARAAPCAAPFDAARDYWPAAARAPAPAYATSFSLHYERSYKVLNISAAATVVVLRACGAPAPPALPGWRAGDARVDLELPLARAALLSTTQIPFFELLGQRGAVAAVEDARLLQSPCVRAGVAAGSVADVLLASAGDDDQVNATALALVNADAVLCSAGWGCPGTARDVPFTDALEPDVRGVSELLIAVAAMTDADALAAPLLRAMAARYECSRAAIDAAAAARVARAPRVAWAYVYAGAWYFASCPNWYCQIVADAGGELLLPAGAGSLPYGGFSDAEAAPLLAQADVLIWANSNFETEARPFLGAAGAAANAPRAAALAGCPAVAAGAVFDILKSGVNAWFETRQAQPDAVLQDFAQAFAPFAPGAAGAAPRTPAQRAAALAAGAAGRVWLRAVFAEPAGAPPAAASCGSAAAATSFMAQSCAAIAPLLQQLRGEQPVAAAGGAAAGGAGAALSAGAAAGVGLGVAALAALAALGAHARGRAAGRAAARAKLVGADTEKVATVAV